MEKEILEEELHGLLDDVVDGVKQKLDISEAVKRRTSSETAARAVSESETVRTEVINPEIEEYREDLRTQFTRLLKAVEENESVRERSEELLEHDIFYQNLESDSEEVREKIIDRLETLHARLEKISGSENEDVWQAVHEEFTRREAEEFIDEMFGFLEELEEHRNELRYSKEVDLSGISKLLPFSVEVDYTPEAFEVMKESEEEVRQELMDRIDTLYDDTIKL